MEIGTRITGEKELFRTFSKMPRSTQNKALRPALRLGAGYIRDLASSNVKAVTDRGYSTGLLARNIRVYSMRKYQGSLRMRVAVRKGAIAKNGARLGLYGSVLDYGKDGQAPRPWMRGAKRNGERQAVNITIQEIKKRISDAVMDAKR